MNKLEAGTRLKAESIAAALVSDKVALSILKEINDSPEFKQLTKKLNKDKLAIVVTGSMDDVKNALVLLGWVRAEGRPLPKEMVLTHPDKTGPLRLVYQSSTNLVRVTCVADSTARTPLLRNELSALTDEFGTLKTTFSSQHEAIVELSKPLPALNFFDRASRVGYLEADSPIALIHGNTCLYAKLNAKYGSLMSVIESSGVVKGFQLYAVRTKR